MRRGGRAHPPWGRSPVLRRIGVAYVDGPEGADALSLAAALAARAGGQVCTFTVLDGSSAPAGAAQLAARLDAAEDIAAKARAAGPEHLLEATEVLEGRAADDPRGRADPAGSDGGPHLVALAAQRTLGDRNHVARADRSGPSEQ